MEEKARELIKYKTEILKLLTVALLGTVGGSITLTVDIINGLPPGDISYLYQPIPLLKGIVVALGFSFAVGLLRGMIIFKNEIIALFMEPYYPEEPKVEDEEKK